MSGYVLSPRVQRDIEDIWNYSVERWNVEQAEKYIRQIHTAIEDVANEPQIARSCDHIRRGYWRYPAGSHVLFFRLIDDGIDIIRVLHSRMDFEQHL